MAGNAEMRHERLLEVSRLDGRRSGEGGQGRRKRRRERGGEKKRNGEYKSEGRGGDNGSGRMKQIGAVEKMKLELTTNGSGLKGRETGPAGRKRRRDGWEEAIARRKKKR